MILRMNIAIPADLLAEAIKAYGQAVLVLVSPSMYPLRYIDSVCYAAAFTPQMTVGIEFRTAEDVANASMFAGAFAAGSGHLGAVVAEGLELPTWWSHKWREIKTLEPVQEISGLTQLQVLLGIPQPIEETPEVIDETA